MQFKHEVLLEFLKSEFLLEYFNFSTFEISFSLLFTDLGIEIISIRGFLKVRGVYQIVKVDTDSGFFEFSLNKCLDMQSYIIDNF